MNLTKEEKEKVKAVKRALLDAEFSPGDRVRIRNVNPFKQPREVKGYGPGWNKRMTGMMGKEYTVLDKRGVEPEKNKPEVWYRLKEDMGRWNWLGEWLEEAEDE